MKKQLLLLLLLIIVLKTYSQENRKFLYATIKDNIRAFENAHVININTNQGTFTNNNGEFRVLAKLNDSLKISFVGYKTRILIVNLNHFGLHHNRINLEKKIYELDEVILKKHNLFGKLELDIKQTPKDHITEMVNTILTDIKKMKLEDILNMPVSEDEIHLKKVTALGIPNSFIGIGVSTGIPDNSSKKQKKIRNHLKFKEKFPKMLISEFGEKFFFKDLKIPQEKYYHFLEYCSPLNIEELYKDGKVLEMLKILQQESKSYLKIINSQE